MQHPEYKIYPSLLDAYMQYLRSDEVWEGYWAFSENPPHTPEEFRAMQWQTVIDRINRVPIPWEEREAADRGTALNEVVDCLVDGRPSQKCRVERVYATEITGNAGDMYDASEVSGDVRVTDRVTALDVTYDGRTFRFDIALCRKLASSFAGSVTQSYAEAELQTDFGPVLLYGFPDYIRPFSVHDLKTTGRYAVGKYRHNSQHLVYPYILREKGCEVNLFEYDVAELGKRGEWHIYTETYAFDTSRDIPLLRHRVEDFIRFINENRGYITDKKIFNEKFNQNG